MTLFGWIWRGTILFVLLTIIYIALTVTNRLKEKTRLKAGYADSKKDMSKDDYVAKGMAKYNRSLKAKLFLGVYMVPVLIAGFLVYLGQL